MIKGGTSQEAAASRTGERVRRLAIGLRSRFAARYDGAVIPAFVSTVQARRTLPQLARWIAVAVAAGTLLAILGPFGSYLNGGAARLLGYWIAAMLLGLLLYGSAFTLVGAWTRRGSLRWWVGLIGATLVASIPEALATRAMAFRLWPELLRLHLPLPTWFAQTAMIGLIMMAAIALLRDRPSSHAIDAPSPLPSGDAATVLIAGDVLALQMEDHYVRVHRPGGSELILMPLGRAIEAIATDGLRTHRSWWVAAHAVAAVEGNARSMRLRLSNGVVAPVARSAVIHLKSAGWLADAAQTTGQGGAA